MANPQPDKFIKISTELFEALCMLHISGASRQILDVIIRKTYGFKKKQDAISLNQFSKMTGIKNPNIPRAIKLLEKSNVILVDRSDYITRYSIQKNYDLWNKTTINSDSSFQPQSTINSDTINSDSSTINSDSETTINSDSNNRYIDKRLIVGEGTDKIQILWIKTFGRNPNLIEQETTENFIKKFGEEKTYQIFKEAVKNNFKSVFTLEKQIDQNGNIKPREKNYASTKTNLRKYGYEYNEEKAKQRLKELEEMDS